MVGAAITLLLAVFLFFRLKIWLVIKDLMGYSSAVKRRSSSKEKNTGTHPVSKRTTSEMLPKRRVGKEQAAATTELLDTEEGLEETALLEPKGEDGSTVLLEEEETTLLADVLEETTLLNESTDNEGRNKDYFIKKEEVIIAHADKTIP